MRAVRLFRLAAALLTCVSLLVPSIAYGAVLDTDLIGDLTVPERSEQVRADAPDVVMKSGVLTTPDGRILWGRNTDGRRAMASTTKIMTAVIVLENADLDEKVEISRDAAGVGESAADIRAGDEYTVQQLLEAMLVKSGNDAATALAEHVGGSEDGFVDMMNDKAVVLGLKDTRYENPHGLDDFGHFTSAADLAVLTRYAMADDEFRRIVGLRSVTVDGGNGDRTLWSSNTLLESYTGANGVKTGWTGSAGYCLAASAEREALELTAIVLGSSSENQRFREAEDLLDWGYENYQSTELASIGVTLATVPVSDYLDVTVDAVVADEVLGYVFVPDGEVTTEVAAVPEIEAPIAAGDRLGTLTFTQGGKLVAQAPLVAAYAVEKPGFFERIGIAFKRFWRAVSGGDDEACRNVSSVWVST